MSSDKSAAKPLLNRTEQALIKRTAKEDPAKARKDLGNMIAVKRGLQECAKIDGITNSPSRRQPMRQVRTLDYEFRTQKDRDTMVAQVRDLVMNFSLMRGILRTHVNNVAGNGPRLQMTTTDMEYNDRFEAYWRQVFATNCDVSGVLDFGRFVRVGFWDFLRDGDAALGIIEKPGFLKLQGITGDRIADPPKEHKRKTRQYTYGIEMDAKAMPLRVHVYQSGKGQPRRDYAGSFKWDDVCWMYDPESFEQRRGISRFVSAINDNQDIREILEAAKGTMKLENWLGVFIKKHPGDSAQQGPFAGNDTYSAYTNDGGTDERREFMVAPGININELMPDEDIQSVKKETPGSTFQEAILFQARLAGLVTGMPLEVALQYYTRGSYAALKGALRQYHGVVIQERENLEFMVCDRVLMRVQNHAHAQYAATGGKMGVEPPKEGTINPYAHAWQWPVLLSLEPEKQELADHRRYALGKCSLDDMSKAENKDWLDITRQRIKEYQTIIQMAKDAEVPPEWVLPRAVIQAQEGELGDSPEKKDD